MGKEIDNFFLISHLYYLYQPEKTPGAQGNVFNAVSLSKSLLGFNSAPHDQVPILCLSPSRYSDPDSEVFKYSGLQSVKH